MEIGYDGIGKDWGPALCGILIFRLQDVAQFALSLRHILALAHLSEYEDEDEVMTKVFA